MPACRPINVVIVKLRGAQLSPKNNPGHCPEGPITGQLHAFIFSLFELAYCLVFTAFRLSPLADFSLVLVSDYLSLTWTVTLIRRHRRRTTQGTNYHQKSQTLLRVHAYM